MQNHFVRILLLGTLFLYSSASGQVTDKPKQKGKFYFFWGYNKDWFSRSDLHFKSKGTEDFDFTVYDVTAHDKPRLDQFYNPEISIPQFSYRIGYTFANHPDMGIEIGFDHAKYIMNRNDVRRVKGKIYDSYLDQDTLISPDFIQFEHTNGANFLMVSFVKKFNILQSKNGISKLFSVLKPGVGIVIPQSEVLLFGTDQNNDYHIAGYVAGIDAGLQYEFRKHLMLQTSFKGVYANYLDVLSVADSKANHSFFCLEFLFSIGYQFSL